MRMENPQALGSLPMQQDLQKNEGTNMHGTVRRASHSCIKKVQDVRCSITQITRAACDLGLEVTGSSLSTASLSAQRHMYNMKLPLRSNKHTTCAAVFQQLIVLEGTDVP
jgi:hypothetical protein